MVTMSIAWRPVVLVWGVCVVWACLASVQDGDVLAPPHARVLRDFLSRKTELRLATVADCFDNVTDANGIKHSRSCDGIVADLRAWTMDPRHDPYYAHGDFNDDGQEDFAVVLVDSSQAAARDERAVVVVFNGPFAPETSPTPHIVTRGRAVSATFLGYGPPRPRPWKLIIGPPESEGQTVEWRAGTYRIR